MELFFVGFIAGGLMTTGQGAQLYKVIKTHKVEDISSPFLAASAIGTILYGLYAYFLSAWSMLAWCVISIFIIVCIALLKIYYEPESDNKMALLEL
jgi:uncharacterized protein with PQ loop repeat